MFVIPVLLIHNFTYSAALYPVEGRCRLFQQQNSSQEISLNAFFARALAVTIGGLLPLALGQTTAHAEQFGWSLTGPAASLGGFPATGSGTLTANEVGQDLEVTGVTGTIAGSAITGLLAVGTLESNDDLLFPTSTLLDTKGLGFVDAAGVAFDIFSFFAPGSVVTPGNNFGEISSLGFGVGTFDLTAVPEPTSIALVGMGLFGLGLLRQRRA
jgi:hypothetical protein